MTTTEQNIVGESDEDFGHHNGFERGQVLHFQVTVELGVGPRADAASNGQAGNTFDDLTHEQVAGDIQSAVEHLGHRVAGIAVDRPVPMTEYRSVEHKS